VIGFSDLKPKQSIHMLEARMIDERAAPQALKNMKC